MQGKSILLVDDEPDIIELMTSRLRSAGYDITSVDNALDAMRQIKNSPPDLIVLDIQMPDIAGTKLCWILKTGQKYSSIPILLLSGRGMDRLDEMIKQVQANDYIRKPFQGQILLEKVSALLGSHAPAGSC